MFAQEYVDALVPYFKGERHDALKPLDSRKYIALLQRLDEAINEYPEESTFWFWRAWARQFYCEVERSQPRHPEFELIEHAYELVFQLNPERIEAYFMLAYLNWDNARRSKFAPANDHSDRLETELYTESCDYALARGYWKLFASHDGYSLIMENRWCPYPFQVETWSVLLEEMLHDVVDPGELDVLYISWGTHWENRAFDTKSRQECLAALEQARWIFEKGANLEDTAANYERILDCQALLAKYHSVSYGGDPVKGLAAWLRQAQQAKDFFLKYRLGSVEDARQYVRGQNHDVTIPVFLLNSPSLTEHHETVEVLVKLEELGAIDLSSSPPVGKLNWFVARCYLFRQQWDTAEHYLCKAHQEMPQEPDLIIDLALAKDELGKEDEAAELLATLPGTSNLSKVIRRSAVRHATNKKLQQAVEGLERLGDHLDRMERKLDTVYGLVGNLGESITTALQDFRTPTAPTAVQDSQSEDEAAGHFAEMVSAELAAILAKQKRLYADIQQKCEGDLHGTWRLLPAPVQEQIVIGESMHILFIQHSIQEYGALITQWGKVAEMLVRIALLNPLGGYLDKIEHKRELVIKTLTPKGILNPFTIERPQYGTTWTKKFTTMSLNEGLGILYAAQPPDEQRIFYQFLEDLQVKPAAVSAWVHQVPGPLNEIRLYRNGATHGKQRYLQDDALSVRHILFAGGLVAQMALLLDHKQE